jgi:hypothetical protein
MAIVIKNATSFLWLVGKASSWLAEVGRIEGCRDEGVGMPASSLSCPSDPQCKDLVLGVCIALYNNLLPPIGTIDIILLFYPRRPADGKKHIEYEHCYTIMTIPEDTRDQCQDSYPLNCCPIASLL